MKKTLSVILSIILTFSVFSLLPFTAQAADYRGVKTPVSSLQVGDIVEIGMYPQSEVSSPGLTEALGAEECTMTSYGYTKAGSTGLDMRYADIALNGEVYRKVYIGEYRPADAAGSENNRQEENGYYAGNTYYFKWEPVEWQVVRLESEGTYLMSRQILDSQPIYAGVLGEYGSIEYLNSTLRQFMNYKFGIAFGDREASKLEEEYLSGNMADYYFPLYYYWAYSSACGFSSDKAEKDAARQASGTAYARSQGLYVAENGCSDYWLCQTASTNRFNFVRYDGGANGYYAPDYTDVGVRPVILLKADAEVEKAQSAVCRITGVHDWGAWSAFSATQHGRVCKVDESHTEVAYHQWTQPEYEWDGAEVTARRYCTDCLYEETEKGSVTAEQSGAPSCSEAGDTTYTATFENFAFSVQIHKAADVPPLPHTFGAQGNERFTCTECGTVDEARKAQAEAADREAAAQAAAEQAAKEAAARAAAEQAAREAAEKAAAGQTGNASGSDAPQDGAGNAASATPGIPAMKKPKAAKQSVKLSWKAVPGATRYVVQYSTDKKFKKNKKQTKKLKGTSVKIKKLKKGKKYYFRIRAVNGGQTSKWSKAKSVKIK